MARSKDHGSLPNPLETPCRGLSPAKRSLQLHILGRYLRNIKRFKNEITMLCLPGQSGWDIEYALSHDIVSKVVGIERDKDIYAKLRDRYEENSRVEVINDSTSRYLKDTDRRFDLIYLDYCSPFSGMIRVDLETIFSRQIIGTDKDMPSPNNPKVGKLMIAFLASRESPSDQVMQENFYSNIFEAAGVEEEPIHTVDRSRFLRLSFNGFLARMRRVNQSARRNVISGVRSCENRQFVNTEAPTWYAYDSLNAPMLTADITFRGYSYKASTYRLNRDCWLLRGKYRDVTKVAVKGFHGMGT
jgi:hypothetical protein